MAKLDLGTVANLLGNPTSAANTINQNSDKIETAIQNTLSRDGTFPNQMEADLDMNNNDILNVDNLSVDTLIIDGKVVQIDDELTEALLISNALSELEDSGLQEEARDNLGLGEVATLDFGDEENTVAEGNDPRIVNALQPDYQNIVSCSDFGAIPDCTGQGIGTDVTPAILAAVNHAITTYGDGCRVDLPAGRYRASTPAILDLAGKRHVTLNFIGTITTDSTPMTFLTLRDGYDVKLVANFLEGGIFAGWLAPNPFVVDYTVVADAPTGGGQEAIKIQGVFGCEVDLRAYGYAGRLMRTTEKVSVDHPQTGAISGFVETGRNFDFSMARCAQSLYCDAGTSPGAGNWGALDRLAIDFDYYAPVWENLNDIEIATLDSAFAISGPIFRGCVVVKGNDWYVGDVDLADLTQGRHVIFTDSPARGSQSIDVTRMRFLNKGTGLYLNNVFNIHTSIEYSAGSSLAFTSALEANNTVNADIRVVGEGYGARLVYITGASTNCVTLRVAEQNFVASDHVIGISGEVTGVVSLLNPILDYAASDKARIRVLGSGLVFIADPVFLGNSGYLFDITQAGNQVYVSGGVRAGTALVSLSESPRSMSDVVGLADYLQGDRRVNSGGNSAGSGGSLGFGIGSSGSQTFSQMAQIKSKLQNQVGTELQGGLSLQFRPTGAAGQGLADGLEIQHTTVDGETVGILLMRLGGAYVSRRVRVGSASSFGPGRGLYVDN